MPHKAASSTNDWAKKVRDLFQADQELSDYYNKTLADGKWSHMMDQTHIGYTNWQEPPRNNHAGRQRDHCSRGRFDGGGRRR